MCRRRCSTPNSSTAGHGGRRVRRRTDRPGRAVDMPHQFSDEFRICCRCDGKGVPGRPRGVPSFRLDLSPDGALHESTRFFDDPGRNQNAWSNLPRYYWCAPGAARRRAPRSSPGTRSRRPTASCRSSPTITPAGAGCFRRHRRDLPLAGQRRRPLLLPLLGPGRPLRRPPRQPLGQPQLDGGPAGVGQPGEQAKWN